jgi:hypothetical protein
MTVFTVKAREIITVLARAETDGAIGDARWTVKPGETLFGHTYEWWASQPIGKLELDAEVQPR